MMRRYEGSPDESESNHRRRMELREVQDPPPFRVLSPGGRILYDPRAVLRSPPPSRAPEPYKVAPQGTSFGRSQRKSSFAIIAETRPPSPRAPRPDSPQRAQLPSSGRVSPFRGRGFKGPPPRARSRPQSPPDSNNRTARSIHDRRVSISQQNSPKRSQIPRPARSRSISASKENESRKASPKFGRRAANRYTASIGNANQENRRISRRDDKQLPAIQGTPTKPSTDRTKQNSHPKPAPRSFGAHRQARSPEKPNRNLLAPPSGKRFVTARPVSRDKSASTEALLDSPSKIPLRREPGSTPSLVKPTPVKHSSQNQLDGSDDPTFKIISKSKKPIGKVNGEAKVEEELGLVDLLKQTSGATGTSSVVNTTTTTAVQPLQIDASSILAEGELVAKLANLEKKQMEQRTSETADADEKPPAKNGYFAQTMIKHFGQNSANGDRAATATLEPAREQSKPAKSSETQVTAEMEKPRDDTTKRTSEDQDKQKPAAEVNHKKTESRTSNGINSNEPKSTSGSPRDSKKASPSKMISSATDAPNVEDNAMESRAPGDSPSSLRSTDTGVSVNTVRGVSSAKEKTGLHLVKRADEIETLSGNVVHLDRNGDRPVASGAGAEGAPEASTTASKTDKTRASTRWRRLRSRWWKRLGVKVGGTGTTGTTNDNSRVPSGGAEGAKPDRQLGKCGCWPKMRCLACRRDPKAQLWPGKQVRGSSTVRLTDPQDEAPGRWNRFKDACKCAGLRKGTWCGWRRRRFQQQQQVAPAEASQSCCPRERRFGALCRSLFARCSCSSLSCRRRKADKPQRTKTVRAKHSLTSVAAPPLSEETRPKIPDVLVEHNSVMRGAIPCLPVPIAWFCLIWNVVLPGSGTVLSGLFNICLGQPRFSAVASPKARFGALIVNIIVGVSQLFTVLFCLVGWGWSIWWGVTMVRLARKYKRFKDSEAAANDPEARAAPETATLPTPGVPARALRGAERAR